MDSKKNLIFTKTEIFLVIFVMQKAKFLYWNGWKQSFYIYVYEPKQKCLHLYFMLRLGRCLKEMLRCLTSVGQFMF